MQTSRNIRLVYLQVETEIQNRQFSVKNMATAISLPFLLMALKNISS
jgi:hypothetical protein